MKWIGRLWRGEYSLGKAFWVFGILISTPSTFCQVRLVTGKE
jgi:hypothetical protein